MTVHDIIKFIIENDDEGSSVKDLMGTADIASRQAKVTRGAGKGGRNTVGTQNSSAKYVDLGNLVFLVSYLTPVAFWNKLSHVVTETDKNWSVTTNSQISRFKSWVNKERGGWEVEPKLEYVTLPQAGITAKFKEEYTRSNLDDKQKGVISHIPRGLKDGGSGSFGSHRTLLRTDDEVPGAPGYIPNSNRWTPPSRTRRR